MSRLKNLSLKKKEKIEHLEYKIEEYLLTPTHNSIQESEFNNLVLRSEFNNLVSRSEFDNSISKIGLIILDKDKILILPNDCFVENYVIYRKSQNNYIQMECQGVTQFPISKMIIQLLIKNSFLD